MKWSSSRPEEPGWWWVKHPFSVIKPVLVHRYTSQGYEHEKGTTFLMVNEGGPSKQLAEPYYNGCYWAGPIDQPEEGP